MSIPGVVAKKLVCQSCRRWALRSFIGAIGGPALQSFTPSFQPKRPFTRSLRSRDESRPVSEENRNDPDITNESNVAVLPQNDTSDPASTIQEPVENQGAPIPWYLQVQQPFQPQDNVLSARQKIPELPEHPPPILQSILERVSVDLGMDDLSLLDLRNVDPPPALGTNLLMVIGTARSEKHLHVSADRLCRWLRSEFLLRPYADGLLGRNELKLKLRRRAKKSRLLSAVGSKSTADTEIDDGIRTGWVCINVGRVEGGELPKTGEELERERQIVGFNSQSGGSSIVVQLMTEEKRGHVGLERLWTGVWKKSKREKEALEVEDGAAISRENVSETTLQNQQPSVDIMIDAQPTQYDTPRKMAC